MHQIATGLWQLSGVPRNMINVYLMEDVLIDAGTRWLRGAFCGSFAAVS